MGLGGKGFRRRKFWFQVVHSFFVSLVKIRVPEHSLHRVLRQSTARQLLVSFVRGGRDVVQRSVPGIWYHAVLGARCRSLNHCHCGITDANFWLCVFHRIHLLSFLSSLS